MRDVLSHKRAKCPFFGAEDGSLKKFSGRKKSIENWPLGSSIYRTLNLESGVTVVCSCIYDTIVDPKDTIIR